MQSGQQNLLHASEDPCCLLQPSNKQQENHNMFIWARKHGLGAGELRPFVSVCAST
jgi:hypothetical protein